MTRNRKFAFVAMSVLAGLSALPMAFADEWNKETEVTFSAPVEAPGVVLQAGSYIFKLADSESDRNIVQIFRKDGDELVTTLLAVPASREKATDKTVITFEERASGEPEAIHEWFYPGETDGVEFVYKDHAREQADQATASSEEDDQDDSILPAAGAEDSGASPDPSETR